MSWCDQRVNWTRKRHEGQTFYKKLYVTGIENLEKWLLKIRESQAIVKKEVPLMLTTYIRPKKANCGFG